MKPGAYVDVTFDIPRPHPAVVLSAEALIFNQNGLQVAIVQRDHVHLQKINLDRDLGKTVEQGASSSSTIRPPT